MSMASDGSISEANDTFLGSRVSDASVSDAPVSDASVSDASVSGTVGEVIGGYQLERVIGSGGMGTVFAAKHARLGRLAAVKLMNFDGLSDSSLLSRFYHEARIVNAVRHPNIVDIFDFVEFEGSRRAACVMELLDGPSLKDLLLGGPLSLRGAVNLTLQLASALEAVHAVGVIHRDLKPANLIILGPHGEDYEKVPSLKLLDFGVAKMPKGLASHQTSEGIVLGTPAYMAPEQVVADHISPKTDVYAVGELLYEMLTGKPAFAGEPMAIFREKLSSVPPKLELPRGLPDAERMTLLIRATLEPEPAKRPTIAELSAELKRGLLANPPRLSFPMPSMLAAAVSPPVRPPFDPPVPSPFASPPAAPHASRPHPSAQDPTDGSAAAPASRPTSAPPSSPARPSSNGRGTHGEGVRTTDRDVRNAPSGVELELAEPAIRRGPSVVPRLEPIRKSRERHSLWLLGPVMALLAAVGVVLYAVEHRARSAVKPTERDSTEQAPAEVPQIDALLSSPSAEHPLNDVLKKIERRAARLSGTALERTLAEARRSFERDTSEGYARAERALLNVLASDPENAAAMASYAENLAIWRGESVTEQERALIRALLSRVALRDPRQPALVRTQAALALARQDRLAAEGFARRAVDQNEGDGLARLLLASTYIEGDTGRALAEIERAQRDAPQLRLYERIRARALANAGRYGEALKLLKKRLDAEPQEVTLLELMADLERELGRFEASVGHYRQATHVPGVRASAPLALGELLLKRGDLAAAEDVFRKVSGFDALSGTHKLRAHLGCARAALGRGRFAEAAEAVEAALRLAPKDPGARLLRAEIFFEMGSMERAEEIATRLLAAEPREPAILVLLGRIALANKAGDRAVALLGEALDADRHDAALRAILAAAYLSFGVEQAASDLIRETVKFDPLEVNDDPRRHTFAIPHRAVAQALAQLERSSSGAFEADGFVSMALVAYQTGALERASALLEKARKAAPEHEVGLLYEAQIAIETGAVAKAESALGILEKKSTYSALLRLMRGRADLRRGLLDDAETELLEAKKRSSELFFVNAELAAIGARRGQDEAKVVLMKMLRARPYLVYMRNLNLSAGL